jgi:hypothetical protein
MVFNRALVARGHVVRVANVYVKVSSAGRRAIGSQVDEVHENHLAAIFYPVENAVRIDLAGIKRPGATARPALSSAPSAQTFIASDYGEHVRLFLFGRAVVFDGEDASAVEHTAAAIVYC